MFQEKLDIKLITLVKENTVLYDFNHAKYMDFNAREVAWQKIGDELKRPAAVCKLRWINIRDVYRRILRKKLQNPGSRIRMYKYESELGFMRPFYRDVSIQSDMDGDEKSGPLWEDEVFEDVDNVNIQNDSDDSQTTVKTEKKSKGSKRKKKRKIYEEEEKPVPPNLEESTSADFDPADPVDAFLLSIGATLKTFSPYHLNLAKSKIFAVVQEHDLEQIVQKSNDVKASESLYMS